MKDSEIKKFIEEHKDLFKSLAENIRCPSCYKLVEPPFFNLGEKFHQAEGCKECYEQNPRD